MHTNQRLKIIGCGGHSKVVLDALLLNENRFEISFCDGNKELIGKKIGEFYIDSDIDSVRDFSGQVHIAIGNNEVRQNIITLYKLQHSLCTVIHPAATVSKTAYVGQGSFVAAQAVVAPESYIGESCIINHGAIVDHDVRIGSCSHIAPNSTLGGNVCVGEGVLIGAGATVLPGITIGHGAIIAAGAVVVRNVTEHTLVKGVPAV